MCECGLSTHAAQRQDPSRTATLRRAFEAEVYRRFRELKGKVNGALVSGDPFGLRVNFTFTTNPQKVAGFMQWLEDQASLGILGVRPGTSVRTVGASAWTSTYIESAYQKGLARSASQLRAGGVKVGDRWVESALRRPIHADRVGLLYTRAFTELSGITQEMDRQLSRVLAQGAADGLAPAQIARNLNDRIDKIGLTRARTLARTEIIAAHAEATLNGFTEAGIEGVEVEAEWITAGDDVVCPVCQALEGKVFDLDEARGMLPVHPNCRCAWLPKVIGGSGIELN